MAYDYYDKQKAMVKFAHALGARGWKVYGYKADESDSMTDYWSPAHCDGIYEKNGFVLCISVSDYMVRSYSGKDEYKYNYSYSSLTIEDKNKIEKLEQMTQERGATAGEEANAKAMIEKIKNNAKSDKPEKELLYKYPVFQANPTRCTWHIEKDGALYDKGTNVYKYYDLPYEYNERTGEVNNNYFRGKNGLTDEEKKLVNDFQSFILKLERIVNNMNTMGDGTAETEQKAKEQQAEQQQIKVTVKEEYKEMEVKDLNSTPEMVEGVYMRLNVNFNYGCSKGKIYKLTSINGEWLHFNSLNQKLTKVLTGSATASNNFSCPKDRFLEWVKKGSISFVTLEEVTKYREVEKWVKAEEIHKSKKSESKETVKNEEVKSNNNSEASTEQATTKQLWALHCATKLDTRELKISKEQASELITKSRNGEDITDIIKNLLKNKSAEQPKQSETIILNYDEIEVTEEDKNNMEALLDYSCQIMDKYNMRYYDLFVNEDYKNEIIGVLNNKVKLTKGLLKALHEGYMSFEGYILTLLNSQKANLYQVKNTSNSTETKTPEQKQDNTKLIEKINSQIETNNKKIEHLSGDFKTNTWKRMREQESRDKTRESLEYDNRILNYLLDKAELNTITDLEKALIVGTFRNDIDSYYSRHFAEKKPTSWVEIRYPQIDYTRPLDGWYNKEVPTKQKRLNKGGIYNTTDLFKAVEEYKIIIEQIEQYDTTDPVKEKIKKLEREYRMNQKGDFHCTENVELLNRLMELADIQNSDKVLEPSAGLGHIADKLKEYTDNIDVCEFMCQYAELLKLKGFEVKANDFLSYNNYNSYDKIVANVPFSNEVNHVKHMYRMLKDTGRIVVITSNHWTFASDRESREFREWLNNLTYEVYDVEQGVFEFTNVSCKILVIDKDINTDSVAM